MACPRDVGEVFGTEQQPCQHRISFGERELWRGGLPPLGREAAPLIPEKQGPAAQSNGGKPPRHRKCRLP
ncbi:hypothetical protein FQ192_31905 [Pseudomonas sp. ANT_J12]|nr:hypothetical protein FQ192_31905 [Pseudomonas sp. ANT_J12]